MTFNLMNPFVQWKETRLPCSTYSPIVVVNNHSPIRYWMFYNVSPCEFISSFISNSTRYISFLPVLDMIKLNITCLQPCLQCVIANHQGIDWYNRRSHVMFPRTETRLPCLRVIFEGRLHSHLLVSQLAAWLVGDIPMNRRNGHSRSDSK